MDAELISAIASVMAALGAASAVMVAVAALRTSRRTALADQFLQSVGEMLAALAQVSEGALELDRKPDGERLSREHLREAFTRFVNASARIGLLDPVLSDNEEYGEWVRAVTNNIAADLLQADESAPLRRSLISEKPVAHESLGRATPAERELLNSSLSFRSLTMIDLEPPDRLPRSFQPPTDWWSEHIVKHGRHGPRNVYSPESSYLVQHARLLDDFVRDYVHPWAQNVVKRGLR